MITALLGSLAAAGVAQKQSMLPYLPASTIMAMSVPDIDASLAEFASMPLAKMWREEEVQDFVRDAREMAHTKFEEAMEQARKMHQQGMFPLDPDQLLNLRLRGGSFALTRMNITEGDFGPMPEVGLLLHLDFGSTAQQWFGLAQMGLTILEQSGQAEVEEFLVGDQKVRAFVPTMAPAGMSMGLHVAMVGDSLLIGTLREDVTGVLANMQSGKQELVATEAYKNSAQHLMVDGAEAEMFMRPGPLFDFGMQGLRIATQVNPKLRKLTWLDIDGIGRAIDAMGLRGVQSVAGVSSYKDGKAVSTTFVAAPAPGRKGFLAGHDKTLDTAFLRWVPKDAVSFMATTMEPMTIYDTLVSALQAYDPKIAEMAMGHLAGMEQKIGFNLRDDLFGAVGDTVVTWSMPMASMMAPPEVAILIKVNDQDKVVKVLQTLCGMSKGRVELDEAEKRGVKTYQFRLNLDNMQGMGGFNPLDMMNPSFAFKDGYLVAGFSPSDIRRVFQRMERTEDDPKGDIRGNKEFAAYANQLPEHMQSMSFTDWKAEFESWYQMLSGLLAFMPQSEDVPFDMQMLPDASTLTKHMFGSLSYSTVDGSGISSTTISPFGPEVAAVLVVALAAGGLAAAGMANVR
ncbi:MAG: hypothetical protein AB7O84_00545 [Planctomycetota bacterium]